MAAKTIPHERKQELIEELRELQQELCETVNQIASIAKELDDQNAIHYVVAPLQIAADAEHYWLTRDSNLTQWIERLAEESGEGENTEDE